MCTSIFAGQFTNAGNDWYFENRVADPPDADAWISWVSGAASKTLLTIPAYVEILVNIWRGMFLTFDPGSIGYRRTPHRTLTLVPCTLVRITTLRTMVASLTQPQTRPASTPITRMPVMVSSPMVHGSRLPPKAMCTRHGTPLLLLSGSQAL